MFRRPGSSAMCFVVMGVSATAITAEPSALPTFAKNSVGMTFVLVPAGSVQFGWPEVYPGVESCPADNPFTQGDEFQKCKMERTPKWFSGTAPLRTVSIDYGFYIQETEVTQEQWFRVMGYNTSLMKGTNPATAPLYPANGFTVRQLEEFVDALNKLEKTDDYRLPSETEWQYACQAGKRELESAREIQSNPRLFAWYSGVAMDTVHATGQKTSNAWGLYDMVGNVSEYVLDAYQTWNAFADFRDDGSPFYPPPRGRGVQLMTRGTSFRSPAVVQSCSARAPVDPDSFLETVGLRVVRSTVKGQSRKYARPFRTDVR